MTTALDLITSSLLDLGVLADGETPTASQAAGGLSKLNNLIDSWNIENLMVYGASEHTLPLNSSDGTYTIGPGGDLDIPRPDNIVAAYVRNPSLPATNRLDFPLYIYNTLEYADIALKGLTVSLPQGVYFDMAYPLITAYVYPVPSTSEYSLVIWDSGLIGNLTLNQTIILAPGYTRALESNLAIELAPSYGVEPSQVTVKIATDSKARIKIQNLQINELTLDPNLGPVFNILTGYYQ